MILAREGRIVIARSSCGAARSSVAMRSTSFFRPRVSATSALSRAPRTARRNRTTDNKPF
jgi:hypothetical protein